MVSLAVSSWLVRNMNSGQKGDGGLDVNGAGGAPAPFGYRCQTCPSFSFYTKYARYSLEPHLSQGA